MQVPAVAYVVDLVPLHVAGGGVVQVTPTHGVTHSPLAASHAPFSAVQSVVVGAYAQTAVPVVPSHVPVAAYVVELPLLHVAAGGVVQLTPMHGVVQWPLAMSHAPFVAAQFVVVGV